MSKALSLLVLGFQNDHDKDYVIPITGAGQLYFLSDGTPNFVPSGSGFTIFELLPNLTSLAAGKDPITVTIGTGTEVPSRAADGGVNLSTQIGTEADNDNAVVIGVSGTPSFTTITAARPPRFRTRVNLTRITKVVFGAGLDENITSPVPSATAGDGAAFYFDPDLEVATGGAAANWILTQKVAGTDTYIDSGVAVVAGVDYDLDIRWGSDLKPRYYINGALVGTGVANTAATAVGVNIGVQINGTPDADPNGHRDFDVRYVQVDTGVVI